MHEGAIVKTVVDISQEIGDGQWRRFRVEFQHDAALGGQQLDKGRGVG